jgi:hypothetical protein
MRVLAVCVVVGLLYGCGGGGGDSGAGQGSVIPSTSPAILGPGQSVVLTAGQTVLVPASTMVHDPATNNTVVISGNHNTVHTSVGSQVTVPASATGAADNTVTTQ